jgi:hypothetical protein
LRERRYDKCDPKNEADESQGLRNEGGQAPQRREPATSPLAPERFAKFWKD